VQGCRGLREEAVLPETHGVPSGLLIHNLVRDDSVFPKRGPAAVCTKTMSALAFSKNKDVREGLSCFLK